MRGPADGAGFAPARPPINRPVTSRLAPDLPANARPATTQPATGRLVPDLSAKARPANAPLAPARPATTQLVTNRPVTGRLAPDLPANARPANAPLAGARHVAPPGPARLAAVPVGVRGRRIARVSRVGRAVGVVLVACGVLALPAVGVAGAAGVPGTETFTISDPRITESSGLAASRRHPGVFWTHNDSDDGPYVYGVDAATGRTVARVTLTGIGDPRDVEGISLGPDGRLWLGDIGDNLGGTWDRVWLYRFEEPRELGDSTVAATRFTVRYADGPRDAEALMVHPVTGRVYIASKHKEKGGLYEGPEPGRMTTEGVNTFRRIDDVPWTTDGAFSPDGKSLTLRGYLWSKTYPWRDGRPVGEGTDAGAPFQGQAESVTYSADGSTLLFGAEGRNSQVIAVPVPGVERPSPKPGAAGTGADASNAPGGESGAGAAAGEATWSKGAVGLVVVLFLGFVIRGWLRRKTGGGAGRD
ncbi:WD40 repeat domain-containing protein [Streptomyces sp. BI20]|uniref:WD40 repeat domain-containing protein n=1 Tax=Streptomyces sp. BI20 TaxID=3403460 RepID=UPI003C78765C